jgi:CheY-like chemotaxis protein
MRLAPSLKAHKPANILLVDDNAHGLVARRNVLQELGYTVVSASGGQEALKLADEQHFDLIVTDYRMPGMDGVALISALRERRFANPIILLSGFLVHLGLNEETTGANLLIQKSANETDHLMRGVKKLLLAPKKPAGSQSAAPRAKRVSSKG